MRSMLSLFALSALALARPTQIVLDDKALGFGSTEVRIIIDVVGKAGAISHESWPESAKDDAETIETEMSAVRESIETLTEDVEYLDGDAVEYFIKHAPESKIDPLSAQIADGAKSVKKLKSLKDKDTIEDLYGIFSEVATSVQTTAIYLSPWLEEFKKYESNVKKFTKSVDGYADDFSAFGKAIEPLLSGKEKDVANNTKSASSALTAFTKKLRDISKQSPHEM